MPVGVTERKRERGRCVSILMTRAGFRCFVKIRLPCCVVVSVMFLGWRESGAFVSRGKRKKRQWRSTHSRWTLHDARWLPLAYLLTGAWGLRPGGDRVLGVCPGYQVGIFSVRKPDDRPNGG